MSTSPLEPAAQPAQAAKDPRVARPSAALVLIRGSGEELEVYWVKRSAAVSYMPEFRAFVGGTQNREDRELEVEGAADDTDRTLRACALRELFEETGVLLADPAPDLTATSAARSRLLAGETTFVELAREHGWRFRAGVLEYASRWISPPFASARFETVFYLARVPSGQEPSVIPGELESGEWVRPVVALKRWHVGAETFAAPILYTMIALASGEERLAERLGEAPEASALPVRRIELKWGVVLQPMKTRPLPPATHTNAYLVGEPEMALIDPGSGAPEDLEALFALISALEQDRRKLKLILLTHHHPDHLGGLDAVRRRYGVPVAAHAETARHVPVDFTLADGDTVPLVPGVGDWTLRAFHTPGHTRGHLCFLHERTRSLFCGDHITGAGTTVIDPPDGDMADYLRSLERLLTLPVETLFPAHGSPQGAAKRRIRGLIAHRLERERKVHDALTAEPATLAQLVPLAYADTPRELWPYAERSLLAHLLKLEAEGKATRLGELWSAGETSA